MATEKKKPRKKVSRKETPRKVAKEPVKPVIEEVPAGNAYELRRRQLIEEKRQLNQNVADEAKRGGTGPKWEKAQRAATERGAAIDKELKKLADEEVLADPATRAGIMAAKIGLPLAGIAGGHMLAKGITKAHLAQLDKNHKNLEAAARAINKLLKDGKALKSPALQAQIKAFADAATKADLAKIKGVGGFRRGAAFMAEAAVAYGIGLSSEDPVIKELMTAAASGLMLAGTTVVTERAIANRTVAAAPVVHTAAVEAARNMSGAKNLKTLQQTMDAAGPLAKQAAKAAKDPVAKGAQAAARKELLAQASKAAGREITKVAEAQAVLQGAGKLSTALKVAGRAVVPVAAALAAVSAYSSSSQAGETNPGVKAGVAALDSVLTLGTATAIADAVKKKPTLKIDHRQAGIDAQAAEARRVVKAGGKLTPAQAVALAQANRTNAGAAQIAATVAAARKNNGTQAQIKDQPGTGDVNVKGHRATSSRGRAYWVDPHKRSRPRS
jgi:hypothetical protein